MVKNYNWDINIEERNRIINLHETATKKLYLFEQDSSADEVLDFSALYEPGKYMITQKINNDLSNKLNQLFKKYENSIIKNIQITIYSSESKVHNYDTEPTSPKYKKSMGVKELAKNRGLFLQKALEQYFNNLKKVINVEPVFTESVILIGDTPAQNFKKFSEYSPEEQEKFRKEQYVKVLLKITYEPKKDPYSEFSKRGEPLYDERGHIVANVYYRSRETQDIKVQGNVDTSREDVLIRFVNDNNQPTGENFIVDGEWWNANAATSRTVDQNFKEKIMSNSKKI